METKVDIAKGNYVFMNYTFQNPEDNHGKDYNDPGLVSLSDDIPRPGRAYFVGFSYQF